MENLYKDLIMLKEAAGNKHYLLDQMARAVYTGNNEDYFERYMKAVEVEREAQDRFIAAIESLTAKV